MQNHTLLCLIPWRVGELAPRQAQVTTQQDFKLTGEFAKWLNLRGELASEGSPTMSQVVKFFRNPNLLGFFPVGPNSGQRGAHRLFFLLGRILPDGDLSSLLLRALIFLGFFRAPQKLGGER